MPEERFRAFGEMAEGVVHDSNNALLSIIGYRELLQNTTHADDRDLLRQQLKTLVADDCVRRCNRWPR